jgi:Raf kinase inhibitor-like YbhB/YbcL family protein
MSTNPRLTLRAPDFEPGSDIPAEFTCDGSDISPALHFGPSPAGTESFALVMDDPDAPGGTWVHWVLYDVPGTARELPAGVPPQGELASGARQGRNDFKRIGYGGPCPPAGPEHRYRFRLYALDKKLGLAPGATRQQVDRAMRGHIVDSAELMGRYRRA